MSQLNIIFLPFAGGSKYSYQVFKPYFSEEYQFHAVDLPGRGGRSSEPLLKDMNRIIDDVFLQIQDLIQEPYVIYGHSMGALLADILTKKMVREGRKVPLHLFLTGCTPPSLQHQEPKRHYLPKEAFISTLKELGGSPDEIWRDPSLTAFFEPILRADFEAIETFNYEETPYAVPMKVMIGLDDKVSYEQAQNWQNETTALIEIKEYSGGHFFIFDHPAQVMNEVMNECTRYTNQEHQLLLQTSEP